MHRQITNKSSKMEKEQIEIRQHPHFLCVLCQECALGKEYCTHYYVPEFGYFSPEPGVIHVKYYCFKSKID